MTYNTLTFEMVMANKANGNLDEKSGHINRHTHTHTLDRLLTLDH